MLCAAPLVHAQVALPATFEGTVDYELTDFGGAESMLTTDPTDATNTVVETVRPAINDPVGQTCFAGTTVAEASGFASPIPFAPGDTKMNVRVWSPEADVRVLFKVEQVGVPTVNVETFSFTTVAMQWETIEFDFANPMPNMNPIDFNATYNKASIFFDFQCNLPPTSTLPGTYYWDDVAFGARPPVSTEEPTAVEGFDLAQNVPNPFDRQTTIDIDLPSDGHVRVRVYNALGQQVATVADRVMTAGAHRLPFDATGLPSGTYVYRLQHGDQTQTQTMTLVR